MIETVKNPKKPHEWKVYLSGKKVGAIRRDPRAQVYRYMPNGGVAKHAGSAFRTLGACVQSLETEKETS